MPDKVYDVAVIGAGSIGIAVAYYLKQFNTGLSVVLIDRNEPMSLTSSVSGENYRNWWPHPTMKAFIERSIALLEEIDRECDQSLILSRSGYLLATRDQQPQALLENLGRTYQGSELRIHQTAPGFQRATDSYSSGVDIIQSRTEIDNAFAGFDSTVETLIHIRQGGQLSTNAIGSAMLASFRDQGGLFVKADVKAIACSNRYVLHLEQTEGANQIEAERVVNAAGPFAQEIAKMVDIELPVFNVMQQKIAFADKSRAIDRRMPFTIDLDPQVLNWTDEEISLLTEDTQFAFLTDTMPGCIHCRPEGRINGTHIKLGWAYNDVRIEASDTPPLDDHFPEVVLRGASRLHPALAVYADGFPREFVHYGGYYTMTDENWPLVGPTAKEGFYVATAMSGFGSMATAAAGELTARWVVEDSLPTYAQDLSLNRYSNKPLLDELAELNNRGLL